MDPIPRSPFDTLETCFRLLTSGPAPLALDGREIGHGLPARLIPLGELRVLLQHPAVTNDLQRAVLRDLVQLAAQQRGKWMVALAGVLLPGLRRIAASVTSVDGRAASQLEADLLVLMHDAIGQPATGAEPFVLGILRFSPPGRPSRHSMTWRGDRRGA